MKLPCRIRITATDYAVETILWPKLTRFLRQYPDVKVEAIIDYGLTDIVAERFDAGVRIGEQVAKDMIAVRIGPDMRIAASSYFNTRSEPKRPQELIVTTASICACPRMADCTPGNSRKTAVS